MNQQLEKQSYAGVVCRSCRQPIPIPTIVLSMESDAGREASSSRESGRGRAFTLRCRVCDKEMPYRTSEIVEFEGTPRPRLSPARRRTLRQDSGDGLSRVASA